MRSKLAVVNKLIKCAYELSGVASFRRKKGNKHKSRAYVALLPLIDSRLAAFVTRANDTPRCVYSLTPQRDNARYSNIWNLNPLLILKEFIY